MNLPESDEAAGMREAYARHLANRGQRIPEYSPTPRPPRPLTDRTEVICETLTRISTPSTGGAEKSRKHSRKAQRPERPGVGQSPGRVCEVIHVRSYNRPSWYTSIGVSRKAKLIEGKGMPDLHGWRFITLTIRRERFDSPLEAYLAASDHMRRFLYACRKAELWSNKAKWCWKLEFHADGWPHWHLLVERKKRMTKEELNLVGKLWGLGRKKVQMVNERDFRYNFKYAFKPALVESEDLDGDDFERCAPSWFLDHQAAKTVNVKWTDEDGNEQIDRVSKPVTTARVRFWQTSRGFYTGRKKDLPPAKEQKTWTVPFTAREILDRQERTVQVIARRASGQYKESACIVLADSSEKFWNLIGFDTVNAGAVGLGVFSFVVPTHRIQTDRKTSWLIQPLLKANRLNLRHAHRLQQKGETLRTC